MTRPCMKAEGRTSHIKEKDNITTREAHESPTICRKHSGEVQSWLPSNGAKIPKIRFASTTKTKNYCTIPALPQHLHCFSTAHRSQHLASSATTSATVSTAITTVSMTMPITIPMTTSTSITPYICSIRHPIALIRTPRRALIHTATSAVITQLTSICVFGRIIDRTLSDWSCVVSGLCVRYGDGVGGQFGFWG